MARPKAPTTAPVASTTSATARKIPPTIRWVFPSARTTSLTAAPKTLGRDGTGDAMLVGQQISRRHGEVKIDGPVAVLSDLESRNGVFVNGARIEKSLLQPNDVVRLGEWVGIVVEAADVADGEFGAIAEGLFGGARLQRGLEPARQVAGTDLPITIQGETGAGKDVLARAIHAWSGRRGAYVAVNCASLPEGLADAELFGYRKGAFTGADRAAPGHFRAAHGGTLFLDEVLELPLPVQAKLLRAIGGSEIVPLGEARAIAVDVRVIVAAQGSLAEAAKAGIFRLDLKARLDGLTVVVPPLRARREDIAPLFLLLMSEKSGGIMPAIEPKLIEQLLLYDWPLNVRELAILARRLLALHGTEPLLKRRFLPDSMLTPAVRESSIPPRAGRTPTDDEAAFDEFVGALRAHEGNLTRAAAAIGISRTRAYRLLEARPTYDRSSSRPPKERE